MSKRRAVIILTSCLPLMDSAYAAQQVKVECWKRLSDGDVHAETSKYPAFNAGFKVLSFRANRKDAEWSYGSCVLAPR